LTVDKRPHKFVYQTSHANHEATLDVRYARCNRYPYTIICLL